MEEARYRRWFFGSASEEGVSPRHHPEPPDPMTQACADFYRQAARGLSFFGFHAKLDLGLSTVLKHAERVYLDIEHDDRSKEIIAGAFAGVADLSTEERYENSQFLLRMFFCAEVDNFLTYVSQLLALLYRHRPECLKSSETVKIQDVLSHETMPELISMLADKRVQSLAYKSIIDLNDDLSRTIGFGLFEEEKRLKRAAAIVDLRNLVVHSRGIVNSIYLRKAKKSELKEGLRIPLDVEIGRETGHFLCAAATDIDKRAVVKFGLPTPITRDSCGL